MKKVYQENSWVHDVPTDIVNIQGQGDYNDLLELLLNGDTLIEERKTDTDGLSAVYRAVLFIANRMLSRVWHPSQGYYERNASLERKGDINRILLAVTQLRMEIGSCGTGGWYLKVSDTKNMRAVDRKLMDLYAEGQVCIRLAEKYYATDDETAWKPKFDEMMTVLWAGHVFIEEQHINRKHA
jgi:hypothetical protein